MSSYAAAAEASPIPVLLSFCIPTYNRAETVHRLVTRILSRPDQDIEVVVLDNGSTDNTLALLERVGDPRLKVFGNGQNRGALFNMINVLDRGSGEYLVYSTDQDHTDPDKIPEFKAFLRDHPGVSCGYCTFDPPPGARHQIFSKGFDCVNAIAYKGRHPTGYFFKNRHLKTIRLTERFSDFDVVDLFPLEFAFAEVGLLGDGAVYQGRLFSPNTGSDVAKRKSATTNGASKTAFFAPAARLKLAVSYSRHIDQLPMPARDKSLLTAQVFFTELVAATLGYKAVLGSEKLCAHYGMPRRDISKPELLKIAAVFCAGYARRYSLHRVSQAPRFIAGLVRLMCRKLSARLA